MKKIIAFVVSLLICVSLPLSVSAEEAKNSVVSDETASIDYSEFAGTTLNVFNWGEYISDGADGSIDVNAEFEKLTGIKVVYSCFDANEDMYTKLVGGGANYDVIIPSDYMIQRLVAEDRLEKLDFSNIPNYKYISDEYKNVVFDPTNEYSVPYNVGMVGLIYNTKVVPSADSWSALWDEQYSGKILMINNSRDAFGVAQFLLGIDVNTTNTADWDAAAEKLKEQKPLLKGYVMDEVFDKMEAGEAALVPYYAGDFLSMYQNNKDLAFCYPKEGTNFFIDSMCIPKDAQHKKAAELYINFMLDPAIATANAMYMCYASPNKGVLENEEYLAFLEELHPDAKNILYPEKTNYKTQLYTNLPQESLKYLNGLWEDLKTSGFDGTMVYVVCGIIIVVLIAIIVYKSIQKKKRYD